jgi:hypothetical protein
MSWLGRLVDRLLTPGKIWFSGLAVLGITLVLIGSYFLAFGGSPHGTDFAGFYTAGTVLKDYPAERLYDFDLQDRVYHQLFPDLAEGRKLPFVYPPFVAALFRPLTSLPFEWAYGVWLLISAGLFLGGLALMRQALTSIPGQDWTLIFVLSLSCPCFLLECWFTGQTTPIGFFALAVALYCERRRRQACSGVTLAACLYKPPLMVLIVPMLLVGRRWRALAGLAAGAAALLALALLVAGAQGCLAYVRHVTQFAQVSGGGGGYFPATKFVDLNHFFQLLLAGRPALVWPLTLTGLVLALPFLVRNWLRTNAFGDEHRELVWACTITSTLVLSPYVPVYDTALVILAALLVTDVHYARRAGPGQPFTPAFKALLVLLYAVPWVSQWIGGLSGVQIYTPVLALFAGYQLVLLREFFG